MKLYYPGNQISKGLFTDGKELQLKSGKEYVGPYYVYVDGLMMTGQTPTEFSLVLFPYTGESASSDSIYDSLSNSGKKINVTPKTIRPNPTEKDKEKGYITRYILYQRNNQDNIYEIDSKQFKLWKQEKSGIDNKLYNIISIRWKIEGPEYDLSDKNGYVPGVVNTNRRTIHKYDTELPILDNFLSDPREFSPYESLYNQPNVTSYTQAFDNCNLLTGDAPELWLLIPEPTGIFCFRYCNFDNQALIPIDWK